jgi:hypothetical protein
MPATAAARRAARARALLLGGAFGDNHSGERRHRRGKARQYALSLEQCAAEVAAMRLGVLRLSF